MAAAEFVKFDMGMRERLPNKVKGQHRWVVTVAHYITPEQIFGRGAIPLDPMTRIQTAIGCFDCEYEWGASPVDCPGVPRR